MPDTDISGLRIDKSQFVYKRSLFTKKRIIIALSIFIILSALVYAFILKKTHTVELSTVSNYYPSQSFTVLNASGYVVASRKASVAPKVTGLLVELNVEEGSKVKRGQIIARLENEDVKAQISQAEANIRLQTHNLESVRAELVDAKENLNRKKGLLDEGFVTRADFDSAEARFKRAEANFKATQSAVDVARAALKSSEIALDYTLIKAPFDGIVLTKNADVGDIVTPFGAATGLKAAVVTLADMDSLQVEVDVSESNISLVKTNQPCEIVIDAVPNKRLKGKVHAIVPTADRAKASILVKVAFIDRDTAILPDMSAKVSFLSKEPTEHDRMPIIAVNKSSLFENNRVFIVKDGILVERQIKTGKDFGDVIEVIEGLKQGDRVVLKPSKKLKNGDRARIKE
ncbi:MAG: efflux RND transporter periplasmic adaptor subunit [Thermodesulfovibrionales bacterium]|nr:efflux RND transporter periplasmic adaptor subunit [Thermodesulfovibrionales bacterium]